MTCSQSKRKEEDMMKATLMIVGAAFVLFAVAFLIWGP